MWKTQRPGWAWHQLLWESPGLGSFLYPTSHEVDGSPSSLLAPTVQDSEAPAPPKCGAGTAQVQMQQGAQLYTLSYLADLVSLSVLGTTLGWG